MRFNSFFNTTMIAGYAFSGGINDGSFHVGEYEDFKAASLEPYIAMRKAYIQYRNKKIKE